MGNSEDQWTEKELKLIADLRSTMRQAAEADADSEMQFEDILMVVFDELAELSPSAYRQSFRNPAGFCHHIARTERASSAARKAYTSMKKDVSFDEAIRLFVFEALCSEFGVEHLSRTRGLMLQLDGKLAKEHSGELKPNEQPPWRRQMVELAKNYFGLLQKENPDNDIGLRQAATKLGKKLTGFSREMRLGPASIYFGANDIAREVASDSVRRVRQLHQAASKKSASPSNEC